MTIDKFKCVLVDNGTYTYAEDDLMDDLRDYWNMEEKLKALIEKWEERENENVIKRANNLLDDYESGKHHAYTKCLVELKEIIE